MLKKVSLLLVLSFLALGQSCFAASVKKLSIFYPAKGAKIDAESTFIVGCADSRSKLKINGEDVMVYPSGSFVKVVPLKYGQNSFTLESAIGKNIHTTKYQILRSTQEAQMPSSPLKIDTESITPKTQIVYNPGDTITVQFKGASGHYASFKIGKETIPMRELSQTEAGTTGIYKGFYKISLADHFKNEKIKVFLDDGKKKLEATAKASITVIPKEDFVVVRCLGDKTVIRNAPDSSGERLSPLPKDTVLVINASDGDYYRAVLNEDNSVWVCKKDVELVSSISSAPQSDLSDLDVYADKNNIYLSLPMEYKLPVLIEQPAPNQLKIDIYGSNNNFSMDDFSDENIKSLKIVEPQKGKLSILLEMRDKQLWGYDYYHKNDEFVVQLSKKPKLDETCPLKNVSVALDAGHGGIEPGAVGPTGIAEKDINLAIVAKLKKELEDAGARVILTRCTDSTTPLYARPEIAKENGALILLSIHCNALPDGQNPYDKHGCGTYYYNLQAKPLAESIQASLLTNLQLKDDGVNKGNFALTRPTIPTAVLVECAYMINPAEYEMLIDPGYQKEFAKAIEQGLENFILGK